MSIIICVVAIISLFSNQTSASQTSENQVEPGQLENSHTGLFAPLDLKAKKKRKKKDQFLFNKLHVTQTKQLLKYITVQCRGSLNLVATLVHRSK